MRNDNESLALMLRRRRREKARARRRTYLLLAGIGFVLFLLVSVVVLLVARDSKNGTGESSLFGPSGKDWTYREMGEYIKKKNLPYRMAKSKNDGMYLYRFVPDGAFGPEFASELGDMGLYESSNTKNEWKFTAVFFTKHRNADAARQAVGRHPPDADIFHWGSWVFEGDKEMLLAIRRVLGSN